MITVNLDITTTTNPVSGTNLFPRPWVHYSLL